MNSSRLFVDFNAILVADASTIINLNGSGRAEDILRILPHKMIVTENAVIELERGRQEAHKDAEKLAHLIEAGLVLRETFGPGGLHIYEELVSGPAVESLDDGEAATIAYAFEVNGVALIDDRKAWSLCSRKYPTVSLASTSELLVHSEITARLGEDDQADAIFAALQVARMRVPHELHQTVIRIIGQDRATLCHSLPKAARTFTP